ncbi:hypothetical protein AB0D14_27880 [Streptomyces sp. NPDC048484]|uniref:hypothetical protein n=1 Tax=Streptomyces sp. NPDC048484 TaxID=3155146 RepID=UPI0034163DCC
MQELKPGFVPGDGRGEDKMRGCMRAHDAWALELPVLMGTMNARAVEIDLGQQGMQAALAVISGRFCMLLRPGLSEQETAFSIRSLLARYIHRPASLLTLWPEPGGQRVVVKEPDDSSDLKLEDPPDVPADVLALYEDGNWAPKDGWRSDDEVLEELKKITADHLKGIVEYIPEEMYPLPDGLGAVVAAGYDSEGLAHPLVFLRGDLPVGLCVDLLGFSLALAADADRGDREPDENGIFYVGTDAGPVCGPGVALLGALMVQRLGRRPEDCDFRLLDPSEVAGPGHELAA